MPAVNLRHIEIFHAVMTTGNLTEAARMLHTSQPTVSRELARFEKVLGLQLFERTRGRLQPTVQGLRLFEEVQRSWYGLDRIVSAAESLREFRQGELSIACLPVFSQSFLPLLLPPFLARYPEVSLQIVPQESPLLEEWLSAQRHDLGLTETLHTPAGTERTPLLTLNEVCVLPAGHPLAAQATLTPPIFRAKTTSACRAPTAIASCSTPCSLSIRLNGGWWSKPTARPRSAPWCAPAPGSRW
ncbi:LysR family transcriptional regulator [Klebsiella pneumoniae]|nr:LysR family transcriptional regulator [Klebsiella pneumoniae]